MKDLYRPVRNTVDLLNIAHELRDKGVDPEFLDTPAHNVDSASGEFTLTIYAGFTTLERAMIRERQAEGIRDHEGEGHLRPGAEAHRAAGGRGPRAHRIRGTQGRGRPRFRRVPQDRIPRARQ